MPRKQQKQEPFWKQIPFSESYVSLLFGLFVVAIVLVGIVFFAPNRQRGMDTQQLTPKQEQQTPSRGPSLGQQKLPTTHLVETGESLWIISEQYYGTGYNWVAIEKANNLKDTANVLSKGTKLVIPRIENNRIVAIDLEAAKTQAIDEPSSRKKDTYTVENDDTLWKIAVKLYGDGYKWVDIATANNLTNPDVIDTGSTLRIPR